MFLFAFFFSLVNCFLIQTGRAGSHSKSIASSELKLNIKRVRPLVRGLFSNTRTCLLYNELEISVLHEAKLSAVLKISHSLYSRRMRVFEPVINRNDV